MKSCPKEETLQAYLDGELTTLRRAEITAHLAGCSICTELVRAWEQSFAVLDRTLAAVLPDVVPTAQLRGQIAAALARQPAPQFTWALWSWRLGWIAAGVLIASLLAWAWLRTSAFKPVQEAHRTAPAPMITPEPFVPSLPATASASPLPRARQRVRRQPIVSRAVAAEVVTEFYPLRAGEDPTGWETMQLVRVELPRSALSEIGLLLTPELVNASVKADVVLGEDGLARAIRFVR